MNALRVRVPRLLASGSSSVLKFQPRTGPFVLSKRTIVTLKDIKYTAHAVARGKGRNGITKLDEPDGLQLQLASPTALGGNGKGNNPEQLFAMGYASCLLGAIQLAARQKGRAQEAANAAVHANVSIGEPNGIPGFGIQVDIDVEGVAEELVRLGHETCPYSRALSQGAQVRVNVK